MKTRVLGEVTWVFQPSTPTVRFLQIGSGAKSSLEDMDDSERSPSSAMSASILSREPFLERRPFSAVDRVVWERGKRL